MSLISRVEHRKSEIIAEFLTGERFTIAKGKRQVAATSITQEPGRLVVRGPRPLSMPAAAAVDVVVVYEPAYRLDVAGAGDIWKRFSFDSRAEADAMVEVVRKAPDVADAELWELTAGGERATLAWSLGEERTLN